jgi:predicted 2-oxoglutarate/Fe(II)-dependent dioxygenase YbiX
METVEIKRPLFHLARTDPCYCGSGERFKTCCGSMAELRDPPHGVHVVRNFVSDDCCAEWIRYLDKQPRRPLAVHSNDDSEPSGLAKQQISGRVTDKVEQGELAEEIVATVGRAYAGPIREATGRPVEWYENPQVLRYEPGGLYGPHSDSDHFLPAEGLWQKVIDRDMSMLLYLNQDFEGGELAFRQFNYLYKPRTGDLLFFPSGGQYAHQALAVRSGIRYVIVSWAAFRDEPRVMTMRPSDSIYPGSDQTPDRMESSD